MQPLTTARLLFWIPLFTVHICWLWSSLAGSVDFCVPYWTGCVSISKAARSSDALFLFRSAMTMSAVLLIYYWLQVGQFLALYNRRAVSSQYLGIIAAFFLVLYANFLGTQGDFYRLLRQYGVIIYFAFTVLAQMLFIKHLLALDEKNIGNYIKIKSGLSLWILVLGIASVIGNAILEGEKKDSWENIIEWQFALSMNIYFLLTAFIWKRLNFSCKPVFTPARNNQEKNGL